MIQYALKWKKGFLPRDAMKRHAVIAEQDPPLENPDLWQDKERALELSRKYFAQVVKYEVIDCGMRDHL